MSHGVSDPSPSCSFRSHARFPKQLLIQTQIRKKKRQQQLSGIREKVRRRNGISGRMGDNRQFSGASAQQQEQWWLSARHKIPLNTQINSGSIESNSQFFQCLISVFGIAEVSRCDCLAVGESAQRPQRIVQQQLTHKTTQSQAIHRPKHNQVFNRHNLSVKLYTQDFTEAEITAGLFQYIGLLFWFGVKPPRKLF